VPPDKPEESRDAWRIIGALEEGIRDLKDQQREHQLRVENALLKVANMELKCPIHESKLKEVESRIERIERGGSGAIGPYRTPSGLQQAILAKVDERVEAVEENTERTIEGRVQAKVTEALVAHLEQQRKEETERSDRRWKRFQWVAGTLLTLIGSGSAVGWCNLSTRQHEDQKATIQALKRRPDPVVIKVPVPVIPDAGKEEP